MTGITLFVQTLCLLLDKGGAGLKAFVPQLQTTFVKSLTDPSKQVSGRSLHDLFPFVLCLISYALCLIPRNVIPITLRRCDPKLLELSGD